MVEEGLLDRRGVHRAQSTRTREIQGPKGSWVDRVRGFIEVLRVPASICRLLIEWRSILPEPAVHPAGHGEQGRVLDVDSVRDPPRPCGKGAGCARSSERVVSVPGAFGRIERGRAMKAKPVFVLQPRESGRLRSQGFVSCNQSRVPSRRRRGLTACDGGRLDSRR